MYMWKYILNIYGYAGMSIYIGRCRYMYSFLHMYIRTDIHIYMQLCYLYVWSSLYIFVGVDI